MKIGRSRDSSRLCKAPGFRLISTHLGVLDFNMAVPSSARDEDRGYVLCIIVAFTLTLALALICCRFYVRIKVTKNLGWDDVLIVLAMVRQGRFSTHVPID